MYSHLDDVFFKRAIELSDDYIKNNSTLVLIDNNIDKISETTNYITWVSHGKLERKAHLIKFYLFLKNMKRPQSLDSKSQLENFDLDWKESYAYA